MIIMTYETRDNSPIGKWYGAEDTAQESASCKPEGRPPTIDKEQQWLKHATLQSTKFSVLNDNSRLYF